MIYNKWADEYNPKTGLTFGLLFSVPIVIGINLFLYAVTTLDDNILNMVMNMINFTLWWWWSGSIERKMWCVVVAEDFESIQMLSIIFCHFHFLCARNRQIALLSVATSDL